MELAALLLVPLLLLAPVAALGDPAYPGYAHPEPEAFGVAQAPGRPERREEFNDGRIIDISHYYREDMPAWESSEGVGEFLQLVRSMSNASDIANFSDLRLTAHSGTHVDAPGHVFQHYYDAGFDVDTLDLAVLNGPALLVDVPKDSNITAAVMESLHIPKGVRRVLFRTLNTERKLMWKKEFDTSYVGFMKDGAQWLVDNTDIKLVGVDYLSVGAFEECIPAHLVFLEKREVILVEALNLEHVIPGLYTLHCLPLRLRGAEGSPARCILINTSSSRRTNRAAAPTVPPPTDDSAPPSRSARHRRINCAAVQIRASPTDPPRRRRDPRRHGGISHATDWICASCAWIHVPSTGFMRRRPDSCAAVEILAPSFGSARRRPDPRNARRIPGTAVKSRLPKHRRCRHSNPRCTQICYFFVSVIQ